MKKCGNFTLIELLVVIGIIVLLAGLILPAVMSAQQKGRITQAKADMASILTALKNVENTYNRMIDPAAVPFTSTTDVDSITGGIRFGGQAPSGSSYDTYEKFILLLTDPQHVATADLNINKRRIKFLDPKPKYDSSASGTVAENKKQLWIDPWGNQYVILINTDFSDTIPHPKGSGTLSAKAVVYSFGPNGTDDGAQNVLTGSSTKSHDDVTSWD
ncbi:type II secretion system protein [Victivallis vadensis]|uniref:type II secretion system protein n=1 Tax=Victivallis vadensis TaxID=172901 RepID=UPI0023F54D52|nr:type II secretion system protein [Victivallis vadensis]